MNSSTKENLYPEELKKDSDTKRVPNLKLYQSTRESLSPVENISYSSRMKRRTQFHRSIDFTITKCAILPCKIIKVNHELIVGISPSPPTRRKNTCTDSVLIKNRTVSRNIFLDQFPI